MRAETIHIDTVLKLEHLTRFLSMIDDVMTMDEGELKTLLRGSVLELAAA